MTITIGSARIDEHGKAVGGKAGDQKQKTTIDYSGEVSMQNFYVSSKGWIILRAIADADALAIGAAMYRACNNPNIGYNQNQRLQIITYGTLTTKPINCDCSSLVRQCVREAGIEVGNFTTYNEASILMKTGKFQKIEYKAGMTLYTGDILVTKTKGHTVIVTSGYARGSVAGIDILVAKPTLKKGSKNKEQVKILQKSLIALGYDLGKYGADGDFGTMTEKAVCNFQLKYMGKNEVDGIYGPKTAKAMEAALK